MTQRAEVAEPLRFDDRELEILEELIGAWIYCNLPGNPRSRRYTAFMREVQTLKEKITDHLAPTPVVNFPSQINDISGKSSL